MSKAHVKRLLKKYNVTRKSLGGMKPSEFVLFAAENYLADAGKEFYFGESHFSCCALSIASENFGGDYWQDCEGLRAVYKEIMDVPYIAYLKDDMSFTEKYNCRLTAMMMFATILEDAGH